ncbi:helix-turn-helix domain-containing protein [Pandoraea bronchicola]|uniref:AraC family transcriptional regulator n=1 Tax=Pandoraea bronchicola TaxID=2508287 RepID=A0A5E5BXI8_9BURK|nr:helix-turn-helix domain-containing protein [Pandoraea bronchicola]VVE90509.1 AraC family transcriptional regulator [Pandoraea bronchicola]
MNRHDDMECATLLTEPVGRRSSGAIRSQATVWLLTERESMFERATAALREQLFDVRVVSDGWQTYDDALFSPPNVVVVDGALRGMDACAFCSLIRGVDRLLRLPLVVVDDGRSSDARTRAFVSGASDCIVYPFLAEELVARLGWQIRAARQGRQSKGDAKPESKSTMAKSAQYAIDLIKGEGLGRWNSKSLASRLGLSDRRLTDQFKASLGVSVADYLRMEKMERAAWLLRNTGVAVRAVAKEAGFRSPCNFSVAFKRHSGMSPSAFRVSAEPQRSGESAQADSPHGCGRDRDFHRQVRGASHTEDIC